MASKGTTRSQMSFWSGHFPSSTLQLEKPISFQPCSYSTLRPFSHATLGLFSQFPHLCQLPLGCCTPGPWALDTTFPCYFLESQISPLTFKLSQPPSLHHDNSPFCFSAEPFTTPICLSQLLVTLWCLAPRGLLPGESSTVTRDFPL